MTSLDERSFSSSIFITCRADMNDRCVLCFFFFRFLPWTRRENSTDYYFCDGWNLPASPVFTVANNRLLHGGMSRNVPRRCGRSQICHLFLLVCANSTWRWVKLIVCYFDCKKVLWIELSQILQGESTCQLQFKNRHWSVCLRRWLIRTWSLYQPKIRHSRRWSVLNWFVRVVTA